MFVDAHCHLADPRFDPIRDAVLERARAAEIGYFVQGGVGPEDWARQMRMASANWFLAFGLHPWFVADHDDAACEAALASLRDLLPRAVALGELGLDRGPRCDPASLPRQRHFFERQLVLARELDKPLVLHVVRAHGEVIAMLRRLGGTWRGLVHAFTGSLEIARDYLDLGLYLSIGGALTRPGYKKLKNAVSDIPLDRLVVESDAPDMAPHGFDRGLNEPCGLWPVAEALGERTNREAREVLRQSAVNLDRIFALELVL